MNGPLVSTNPLQYVILFINQLQRTIGNKHPIFSWSSPPIHATHLDSTHAPPMYLVVLNQDYSRWVFPRHHYHSFTLGAIHALKMLPITFRPKGGRTTQELCFEKCIGNLGFIATKQGWPTFSPFLVRSSLLQDQQQHRKASVENVEGAAAMCLCAA